MEFKSPGKQDMTYEKIPKKKLKLLTELDCPIPDGCESTVEFLLELEADVFWDLCKATLDRMDKDKSQQLLSVIGDMLEGFPKEREEFREIEAQFKEYFDEMDAGVSLISRDPEEIDE